MISVRPPSSQNLHWAPKVTKGTILRFITLWVHALEIAFEVVNYPRRFVHYVDLFLYVVMFWGRYDDALGRTNFPELPWRITSDSMTRLTSPKKPRLPKVARLSQQRYGWFVTTQRSTKDWHGSVCHNSEGLFPEKAMCMCVCKERNSLRLENCISSS